MLKQVSNDRPRRRVALVTLGQSSKEDSLVLEITSFLPKQTEVMVVGVLDGLTREEVETKYAPLSPSRSFFTKMADGDEVRVDREFIHHRYKACIRSLDGTVDFIGVLCSGELPILRTRTPLLIPNGLVQGCLTALRSSRPWGIVMPTEESLRRMNQTLSRWRLKAVGCVLSPCSAQQKDIEHCAMILLQGRVSAVLLNCFGYTQETVEALQKILAVPIVRVSSLFAHVLAELV